jgi:polyisoprenyl-phosphate glycosyltransferase
LGGLLSTVLVTGAGGFVGSAVVRRLVRPGTDLWDGSRVDRVVALLRSEGSPHRLEVLTGDDPWTIERADVHDAGALGEVLRRVRPRAVVNTALDAAVHAGKTVEHGPLETLFTELARLEGDRIIHAGSAWVLAPGIGLAEDAVVDPRSPYARHKAAEDELLPHLGERSAVGWINLRLFNIFGRYEMSSRLLPYLVSRLLHGEPADVSHGDQLRDFNDVDDIAESFALALRAPESACGAVYHIGSGRATTVREFALGVAEVVGDPTLIRFGAGRTPDQDLPSLVAEPARARRLLGWRPHSSLEERLRTATEWWLARLHGPAIPGQRREEMLR